MMSVAGIYRFYRLNSAHNLYKSPSRHLSENKSQYHEKPYAYNYFCTTIADIGRRTGISGMLSAASGRDIRLGVVVHLAVHHLCRIGVWRSRVCQNNGEQEIIITEISIKSIDSIITIPSIIQSKKS